MSSSEELERHLRAHFAKLDCSFLDEWTSSSSVGGGGGELAALTTAHCFEAVVRLLWRIRPALKSRVPSFLLPPSATARFRVATVVCEAISEVGVRERVGFQDLLYGTGKELSGLILRLLQIVPRDGEEDEREEQISFHDALLHRARLLTAEDRLWVPEFCRALKLRHDGRFWCPTEAESEEFPLSAVLDRPLAAILESANDRRELAAALYAEQLREAEKALQVTDGEDSSSAPVRPKPALLPKPSLKSSDPAPIEDAAALLERAEAEADLRQAEAALAERESIEQRIHSKRARFVQERALVADELAAFDERLMTILEDPEGARAKIEKFMDEREARAHKLQSRWEEARGEKLGELRALREEYREMSGPDSAHERLLAARAEMERLEVAKAAYESRAQKLATRMSRMGDDEEEAGAINRHSYVKKLLEVTANLKKQRDELSKVWRETDMIMKDIKWAEQAGVRTFDLLEETLYKRVDRSPKDERLYKNFVTMYNKCQLIVREAEHVGHSKKRKEQLVDKVDIANASPLGAQIVPMLEDLASIEEENRQIEELLEAA